MLTMTQARKKLAQDIVHAAIEYADASAARPAAEHLQRVIDARRRLRDLANEYKALPMDLPRRPITGVTDTSAAAASTLPDISGDCRLVFDEIWARRTVGLTCDQIEVILNRSHQSMSARVNQLRDSGWIRASGPRRPTRSGRTATVWIPTDAARHKTTLDAKPVTS